MHTCLLEKETLENKDCIVIDCCYLFLGSHTKNEKNKKKYIKKYSEEIQKIIEVRK
jgi:adenosyl cobinamide kinase/adenosyl cobinamide phosphate guanylyltransferase